MKKKFLALMAVVMAFGVAGCSKKEAAVADEEKKEILVVSFGTSYDDNRELSIGGIEKAIQNEFTDYEVKRAFTSQIVIDILEDKGLEVDNVEEALDRAVEDGVNTLIVQPTHLMNGFEYTDLEKTLEDYTSKFDKISLAKPLLTDDADFEAVAKAITAKTAKYDDGETAICFMGHGTEAESNKIYEKLQSVLTDGGYENYFVGTVEAEPSLETLINSVNEADKYKKVVLLPLMVVAGDHANNDMAGDEEGSWKTEFTNAGYEVECVLEGIGQNEDIQKIYVQHTKDALNAIQE